LVIPKNSHQAIMRRNFDEIGGKSYGINKPLCTLFKGKNHSKEMTQKTEKKHLDYELKMLKPRCS